MSKRFQALINGMWETSVLPTMNPKSDVYNISFEVKKQIWSEFCKLVTRNINYSFLAYSGYTMILTAAPKDYYITGYCKGLPRRFEVIYTPNLEMTKFIAMNRESITCKLNPENSIAYAFSKLNEAFTKNQIEYETDILKIFISSTYNKGTKVRYYDSKENIYKEGIITGYYQGNKECNKTFRYTIQMKDRAGNIYHTNINEDSKDLKLLGVAK